MPKKYNKTTRQLGAFGRTALRIKKLKEQLLENPDDEILQVKLERNQQALDNLEAKMKL